MKMSENKRTVKTLNGTAGNKSNMLETTYWRPQNSLYYTWRVDFLGSGNAIWFQGLLAGPTVEILDFWKQNLSHSLPVGTN